MRALPGVYPRYPLPLQPHGFEGLLAVVVVVDARDLAEWIVRGAEAGTTGVRSRL